MTEQTYRAQIGTANHVKLIRLADGTFAIAAALYTDNGDQSIIPIKLGDSGSLDAFGRQRVSNPVSRFNSQLQYNTGTLLWETVTAGGGTETHLPNESTVRMDVGTASGDSVIRQQRGYNRYQPGRSQFIQVTFVFGAPKTNLYQYSGYGDAQNGIFVETVGTSIHINLRSYVSGAIVNNRISQSDWNIDRLDGSGPSGIVLDLTQRQIFVIDLEWLAVGRVRTGFNINGMMYYAHEFDHANNGVSAYMTTANLPLEYGIVNLGVTASASSMKHICGNVDSEGGYQDDFGIPFSAGNAATTITVSTRRPVLTIRPKLTFNSIVNRVQIVPYELVPYIATNGAYIEIVYGGTLTGASFADVNATASAIERDVAATAISGGIVLWSGAIPAAGPGGNARGGGTQSITSKLPIALNRAGAHPTTPYTDNLSVVVTGIGGNATVSMALNWREIR